VEEIMKHIVFYRENNKFDDILTDKVIKKETSTKLQYYQHLIVGYYDYKGAGDKTTSYILLKYGDDIKNFDSIVPDRSPIMGQDYVPDRREKSRLKIISN
jgi:hypothetical protein